MQEQNKVRVAALADLHYKKSSLGKLKDLFMRASEAADVLLLCGDMTDSGLPEEAEILAQDIKKFVRIPCLSVVGNHDFESGKIQHVQEILIEAGMQILDGDAVEILDVGFAGVCGFCGGFDKHMLTPWGEPIIKAFVQEALDHALRLENALTRLKTDRRVVLLHYSPIRETVQGENPEIFPFIGSSRLENPITNFMFRWSFMVTLITVHLGARRPRKFPCITLRFRSSLSSSRKKCRSLCMKFS
jgi:Icc-related predicted phosphoesterase